METGVRRHEGRLARLSIPGSARLAVGVLIVIALALILASALFSLLHPAAISGNADSVADDAASLHVVFLTTCSPFGALAECLSVDALIAAQPPT
nr:MAG: hypothetical protein DIU68_17470 [Chloroflexota bacterium]